MVTLLNISSSNLVISDAGEADVKPVESTSFRVTVLPDRTLFSGRSLKYCRTASIFQIKICLGGRGRCLNIPNIISATLRLSFIFLRSIRSWKADITDPCDTTVLCWRYSSNNSAQKSKI